MKSANKLWRESGTTLSFKEWIDRKNKMEKSSGESFIPYKNADGDSSFSSIDETLKASESQIKAAGGYKPTADKSKVLGLDKGVLIFSTVVILGSIGYYIYQKRKK